MHFNFLVRSAMVWHISTTFFARRKDKNSQLMIFVERHSFPVPIFLLLPKTMPLSGHYPEYWHHTIVTIINVVVVILLLFPPLILPVLLTTITLYYLGRDMIIIPDYLGRNMTIISDYEPTNMLDYSMWKRYNYSLRWCIWSAECH